MADLTQVELQHLRHLIGAHETAYQKLNAYSAQAVDPQIKQIFSKSAQDFQYELFRIAQTKGYYVPSQKATVTEINNVKTNLS